MGFFEEIFKIITNYYPLLIKGTFGTIILALFSVLFGTIIGTVVAIAKLSKIKILNKIASVYISIIRGTPVYVQILIIYMGLSIVEDKFVAGIIALSINSGAYVAEIIRGGIQAVDKGQTEAAISLGMNKWGTMKEIILPQAIKNILPALGNEFVTIIKESAIIVAIGAKDLMYYINEIKAQTYLTFATLVIASMIYWVLTSSISKLVAMFERRLKESD